MTNQDKPDWRRTVELLPESYSPTKEELEEDVSIDASPWDVARALVQPVKVVEKSVSKHRAELRRKRAAEDRRKRSSP